MKSPCDGFDKDYWGLSYKQALEHILKVDPRKTITIAYSHAPWSDSLKILPKLDQERFKEVDKDVANYYLQDYYPSTDCYYSNNSFFSIKVDGVPITDVIKLS